MTRSNALLVSLVASACVSLNPSLWSQDKPKRLKSEQLLAAAQLQNGLGTGADAAPWHVKAQFDTYDKDGKRAHGGLFEEWWFAPKSYKSIYTFAGKKQIDVATDKGLFRSGDQAWVGLQDALVAQLLIDPLAVHPYNQKTNDLGDVTRAAAAGKVRCLTVLHHPGPGEQPTDILRADPNMFPSHCFDGDTTLLRFETGGSGRTVTMFDDPVHLKNRAVAQSIQVTDKGKPYLLVKVAVAELLPSDALAVNPPPGSEGPLGGSVEIPDDRLVIREGLQEAVRSLFGEIREGDTTPIELRLNISREGKVTEVKVVSGPAYATTALMRAARKVSFEPFKVLGEPVEVTTTYHLPSLSMPPGTRR